MPWPIDRDRQTTITLSNMVQVMGVVWYVIPTYDRIKWFGSAMNATTDPTKGDVSYVATQASRKHTTAKNVYNKKKTYVCTLFF